MCMLSVMPMPGLWNSDLRAELENGAEVNTDGHGFAVIVGRHIEVGKSMSADDAIAEFAKAYARATGPALFHSRWTTHGETTLANVHPFPVRGAKGDTYIAHNGVLPASAFPRKGDTRSDTRIFADEIMPARYRRLDSPQVREHLDKWLGSNKIAVLTTSREYRRNVYVFGLHRGEWSSDTGAWHSNNGFRGWGKWRGYSGTGTGYSWQPTAAVIGAGAAQSCELPTSADDKGDTAGMHECIECGALAAFPLAYCTACGSCQECGNLWDACLCYTSSAAIAAIRNDEKG